MRRVAFAVATAVLLAVSAGVRASSPTVQVSYDTIIGMPVAQRQAVLKALDPDALLALNRTNIDRWLEQNRYRLTTSQVALVRDVRMSLEPDQRDLENALALQKRMRCELWRSDVLALSMTHRDRPASRLSDVGFWVAECVVKKVVRTVF